MFGVFYFILIRPQVKQQKEHQAMLGKLGKGDEIITRGGLIGKITGVSDDSVLVLELQEKVRVRDPAHLRRGQVGRQGARAGARARRAASDRRESRSRSAQRRPHGSQSQVAHVLADR